MLGYYATVEVLHLPFLTPAHTLKMAQAAYLVALTMDGN